MTDKPAAQFVDGISFDLDDHTFITDVVIVAKTVHMDTGRIGLYLSQSDGVSWIEKIGMLRAAERIESVGLAKDDDD